MNAEKGRFGYRSGPSYVHKVVEDAEPNLESDFKVWKNKNPGKKFLVSVNRELTDRKLVHSFILINTNANICAKTIYHLMTLFSILDKSHCDEEAYLLAIIIFGDLYFRSEDISYARNWLEQYFPCLMEFQTPTWLDLITIAQDVSYEGFVFPFVVNLKIKSEPIL